MAGASRSRRATSRPTPTPCSRCNRSHGALAGAVELHLTYDEEAGGSIGPKTIGYDEGLTRPDYAISAGFSYAIVTAHNGCLHLEVAITGKSAHAAHPETGHDALEAAARVLNALYAHREGLSASRSGRRGHRQSDPGRRPDQGRHRRRRHVYDAVALRLDRRIIPEEDGAEVERGS